MQIKTVPTSITALIICSALTGCTLSSQPAPTQEIPIVSQQTEWQALSRTAMAITGNITLSDNQLIFSNKTSINLDLIEHDAITKQTLFRVTGNSNPTLLNGNLLCGQQPVDYLVIQLSDNVSTYSDMQMMAYYYPGSLRLSELALKNPDLCALYTYMGHDSKHKER